MAKIIHHLFVDEVNARKMAEDRITSGFATLASQNKLDDVSVETVIDEAEVSRDTFYKCFNGIEDLSQTTAKTLVDEIFPEIKKWVIPDSDIAILVAKKTRLAVLFCTNFPMLGKLLLKVKWPVQNKELKILQDIKKDVEEGIKQGRFADMPSSIGVNIIFSTLRSVIQEMLQSTCPADYQDQAIYQMLLGLGVDAQSATEISKLPLSELPPLPNKGLAGKILNLIIQYQTR